MTNLPKKSRSKTVGFCNCVFVFASRKVATTALSEPTTINCTPPYTNKAITLQNARHMAQVGENVAVSQQSLPQIQQKKSGGTKGGGKGGAKQKERLVYRHPLPIILRDAYNPLLPTLPSLISHLYAFYVKRQRPQQHPLVQALYLPLSKSVWVVDPDQAWILWTQGFFGKGSLSRSEPTWLTRKVKQLNGDPDACRYLLLRAYVI